MFERFQSFEIGGRRLRCEFKRELQQSAGSDLFFSPLSIYLSLQRLKLICIADLSLDDEEAKVLWEQLNRFKESTQTELPFPSTLTRLQRKQIHYFADRLGLVHYSQVCVYVF